MKLTNLISSIAFLILGAGFTFEAMKLRTGSFKNPGPGLFPLIIGACIVTSYALLSYSYRREELLVVASAVFILYIFTNISGWLAYRRRNRDFTR